MFSKINFKQLVFCYLNFKIATNVSNCLFEYKADLLLYVRRNKAFCVFEMSEYIQYVCNCPICAQCNSARTYTNIVMHGA